jgi:hypothetical protein
MFPRLGRLGTACRDKQCEENKGQWPVNEGSDLHESVKKVAAGGDRRKASANQTAPWIPSTILRAGKIFVDALRTILQFENHQSAFPAFLTNLWQDSPSQKRQFAGAHPNSFHQHTLIHGGS